jgi:hypothetical protein
MWVTFLLSEHLHDVGSLAAKPIYGAINKQHNVDERLPVIFLPNTAPTWNSYLPCQITQ